MIILAFNLTITHNFSLVIDNPTDNDSNMEKTPFKKFTGTIMLYFSVETYIIMVVSFVMSPRLAPRLKMKKWGLSPIK